IDRREVERDLAALSQAERRTIKAFAIRVGTHSVWLPGALKPRARLFAQAFVRADTAATAPRALASRGLRLVDGLEVGVEALERMAALRTEGGGKLSDEALAELGWSQAEARRVIGALRTPRRDRPEVEPRTRPDSPFAALAVLTAPAEPRRKRRARRRRTSKAPPP
ncbi:MAG: phosphonate-binding protein, partial [Brevundimonas sp.]